MGLLVGPLLSGSLTDSFGYYYMNLTLGGSKPSSAFLCSTRIVLTLFVACICVVLSLLTITFLKGKSTSRVSESTDVDATPTA